MSVISEERFAKVEEMISKLLERLKKMDDMVFNQKFLHDNFAAFKKEFDAFKSHQD